MKRGRSQCRPIDHGSRPGLSLDRRAKGNQLVDDRDNETWLIDAGHMVIEKRIAEGEAALTPRELLIHRFWVVDYSMRNAGDLAAARDLAPQFRLEGLAAAQALGHPGAIALFSLGEGELERRYFDLFDGVCDELRTTETPPAGR